MPRQMVLINANVLKPPVSPVGLEYVAEAVLRAGLPLRVIDLVFEEDWRTALRRELKTAEAMLVGVSVRNTDDCSFLSGQSFIPWIRQVVGEVRKHTDAPVFLGGVGFSTMPDVVVRATGADGGVAGDGEEAVVRLARRLEEGSDYTSLPNLIFRRGDDVIVTPRENVHLSRLPVPTRSVFRNKQYEEQGAMVGVETKRGCAMPCMYCADPVAKGSHVRLRPPHLVAQEFRNLVAQGVTWFHMCDAEFNLPIGHAKDVCRELIQSGLGQRIRWYAYCAPKPFDRELALLMKAAGCAGINFGVDSLSDAQLHRLGRRFSAEDVRELTMLLNRERVNYLFDLLVGAPGETPATVQETIRRAREYGVEQAGIAVGVRVYPGTRLAGAISAGLIKEGLIPAGNRRPELPLFYLSPALGDDVAGLLKRLVGDDSRFLLLAAPGAEGSYNYAGDDLLSRLIQEGARGAYWNILRPKGGITKSQAPNPKAPVPRADWVRDSK